MGWAARQRAAGIRLELTWFDPRECWKKKHSKGKVEYFHHPDSKSGYEAALAEWFDFKRKLGGIKPHTEIVKHHQHLFGKVQQWYDAYGVSESEAKLASQVSAFLNWLGASLNHDFVEPFTFPVSGRVWLSQRHELITDFDFLTLMTPAFELSEKWIDRIDRATATVLDKEPQTIEYWLKKYLTKVEARAGKFIVEKTSDDRKYKLVHFQKYCDKLAHISTIDSDYVEAYHAKIDEANIERSSKEGYFKAFRMFVRKCAQTKGCELQQPANLESREFSFREKIGTGRKRMAKKQLLWTSEEFNKAVNALPSPYNCFLMLMLNCGFRHVDLGHLQHSDVDLKKRRITIQRQKLNQQETAPVICYPLWPKTVELMKKAKSNDPVYYFRNKAGGSVEDSTKSWWKDHRENYAAGKRLDFIRKTGSTIVARHDHNLDEMYLGESLQTTTKKHYSFNDGEPCQALDDAIGVLGSQFGFCEAPVKKVALTKEMLDKLKKAGIDVSKL